MTSSTSVTTTFLHNSQGMHATTLNNSEGVPPDGPQAPPAGHAVPAQAHATPAASPANSQTAAVKGDVSGDRRDAKGKEEEWPEGIDPANAEHGLSAQQVMRVAQLRMRLCFSSAQQLCCQSPAASFECAPQIPHKCILLSHAADRVARA